MSSHNFALVKYMVLKDENTRWQFLLDTLTFRVVEPDADSPLKLIVILTKNGREITLERHNYSKGVSVWQVEPCQLWFKAIKEQK